LKTNASYPRELWQTTHQWLLLSGNKANAKYCREEISTHSDYPALTAVTDFLDTGGMGYNAVQADASYIHEFNYPLLAHIKQPGSEYLHLITDANQWNKETAVTQHWSGIALYAAKDAIWHNEENDAADKLARKNKYLVAAFVTEGLHYLLALYLFIQMQ
jgi:hypothetical protein